MNMIDIEEKIRRIFGYDEESLLAEMEEAERVWEAEKAANPEAAANAQLQADAEVEQLMKKIKEKGIQPISENEYEENERKNNLKIIKLSKKDRE